MCQIGDIIVVKKVKDSATSNDPNGEIGRHSFVVLSNQQGEIEGMPFDLVCNIMSSFEGKSPEYKQRKLLFPENMGYEASEEIINNGHGKDGFIKAGIYYLFNSETTDYYVLGQVSIPLYNQLCEYINNMNDDDIRYVVDNLM